MVGKVESRLKKIVSEVCKERESDLIEIECDKDHVHILIEVDPQFGVHRLVKLIKGRSSKICSLCHTKKDELPLKQRVYDCDCCTLKIDRDLNAAINILREGASSLGLDGVIRDSYDLVPVD